MTHAEINPAGSPSDSFGSGPTQAGWPPLEIPLVRPAGFRGVRCIGALGPKPKHPRGKPAGFSCVEASFGRSNCIDTHRRKAEGFQQAITISIDRCYPGLTHRGFELCDFVLVLEREGNVVQTVKQAVLAERFDFEACRKAMLVIDGLLFQIDHQSIR